MMVFRKIYRTRPSATHLVFDDDPLTYHKIRDVALREAFLSFEHDPVFGERNLDTGLQMLFGRKIKLVALKQPDDADCSPAYFIRCLFVVTHRRSPFRSQGCLALVFESLDEKG